MERESKVSDKVKEKIAVGVVESLKLTQSGNSYTFKIGGANFYTKKPTFKEGERIAFLYTTSETKEGAVFNWGFQTDKIPPAIIDKMKDIPTLPKQNEGISFREQLILRENALNCASNGITFNKDASFSDNAEDLVRFAKAIFEKAWGLEWSLTNQYK